MLGAAESYLGAFAVELGHDGARLASLATVPLCVGAVAQLLSPQLSVLCGGRKRLVVTGAVGQALGLVWLAAIAFAQAPAFGLLLAAKCAFWGAAGMLVPSWNAWMGDLTSGEDRPRYFAQRSAVAHVALLASFGAAAVLLHFSGGILLEGYGTLFLGAVFARLGSAYLLWRQLDPQGEPGTAEPSPSWARRLRQALSRSRWRIASYAAAVWLGTQIAAPFFTPYMLRDLGLGYPAYAGLSALSILAKALTFPLCHRLAGALGLRASLLLAGVGVAAVPLLWSNATGPVGLVSVHLLGGSAWAIFEYCTFQILMAGAAPGASAEFFSLSNALTASGQLVGSLLGGCLVQGEVTYRELFLISAALRAAPLVLLVGRLPPFPARLRELYLRLQTVRAGQGAAQRPIIVPERGDR